MADHSFPIECRLSTLSIGLQLQSTTFSPHIIYRASVCKFAVRILPMSSSVCLKTAGRHRTLWRTARHINDQRSYDSAICVPQTSDDDDDDDDDDE